MLRKTMKTLVQGALTAPMFLAMLGAPAQAGDAKTYPGATCVRTSGATPSYSTAAIGNPSSSQWLYLNCPTVNDSMNENVQNSWVGVLDRHYSSNVRCSINSATSARWRSSVS